MRKLHCIHFSQFIHSRSISVRLSASKSVLDPFPAPLPLFQLAKFGCAHSPINPSPPPPRSTEIFVPPRGKSLRNSPQIPVTSKKPQMSESGNSNKAVVVLVTGASGYLGAHCVQQLLAQGYTVKGTVRSLENKAKVQPLLDLAAPFPEGRLQLVEADLTTAESWPSAVQGCDYVLHMASPFPIVADESIVQIAVEGTLNVLRACAKCPRVRKVVLTSSCAAINEGHDDEDRVFTEQDWTNTESPKVLPYSRSKTEAERTAWDFVRSFKEGDNHFRLTCLNPTLIVGPILIDTQGTSISVIRRFLNNEMPLVPALQLALVDVRDVAKAHIAAMQRAESDGQRILLTWQPSFWFRDIARVLAFEFRSQGYWLPRLQMPSFGVWLYSFFDVEARSVLARLNRHVQFDSSKAHTLLGMEMRNPEEALVEMAYSMIERGILPRTAQYRGQQHAKSNGV